MNIVGCVDECDRRRVLPGVHSFASDFWAFGCVLFQLYFGHLPFAASGTKSEDRDAAEDMTGLIGRICNSDPFAELGTCS